MSTARVSLKILDSEVKFVEDLTRSRSVEFDVVKSFHRVNQNRFSHLLLTFNFDLKLIPSIFYIEADSLKLYTLQSVPLGIYLKIEINSSHIFANVANLNHKRFLDSTLKFNFIPSL